MRAFNRSITPRTYPRDVPSPGGSARGGVVPDSRVVQPADLRADCTNCFALCCTALRFDASADFAFDKPAGTPCRHLTTELRCGVHADLRARGFNGCAVYDCQ